MTAMRAAPLLPENNDGSSYLYISLCDPTPESIHREPPCEACPLRRLAGTPPSTQRPFLSLRRVKRLTHIAALLQARVYLRNDPLGAPASRCLCAARGAFLQVGYRAQ